MFGSRSVWEHVSMCVMVGWTKTGQIRCKRLQGSDRAGKPLVTWKHRRQKEELVVPRRECGTVLKYAVFQDSTVKEVWKAATKFRCNNTIYLLAQTSLSFVQSNTESTLQSHFSKPMSEFSVCIHLWPRCKFMFKNFSICNFNISKLGKILN